MEETEEMAPDRSYPGSNRPNRYFSSDVGVRGENQDNRDYNDEEAGNRDYYGGISEGRISLPGNGDSSSHGELETDEIDGRRTDSVAESYSANRSVSHE